MSNRVSSKLAENGQGKYIVTIGFTFAEITEVRRALSVAIGDTRKKTKDPERTARQHELHGYRTEVLSRALSYLYEAHTIIKDAINRRQQGRWLAGSKKEE